MVSFLGQNAELLDPPIRRKIKAPLGFYGITLSCFEFFKFRVKKVYNMAARGVGLFDSSDDEEEFLGFIMWDKTRIIR